MADEQVPEAQAEAAPARVHRQVPAVDPVPPVDVNPSGLPAVPEEKLRTIRNASNTAIAISINNAKAIQEQNPEAAAFLAALEKELYDVREVPRPTAGEGA